MTEQTRQREWDIYRCILITAEKILWDVESNVNILMGPPDIVVEVNIGLFNTPYCTVHVTVNGIMRACACRGVRGGVSGVGGGGWRC